MSEPILRVQAALTGRDLVLLGWLADHGVLTTEQIAAALFPSVNFAQRRLRALLSMRVVDRFRPQRPDGGSYPYHWLLAQLGTDVVASQRGEPVPRRDQARQRRWQLTSRANLPHLLGVNEFFTQLAAHARTHPDAELQRWWSAARCQQAGAFSSHVRSDGRVDAVALAYRPRVRPDGHGIFTARTATTAFFLEYDTGTEFSGGRGPCWSPDLRVSAAQRLMLERYRSPQVWCKRSGGLSPIRVAAAAQASVDVGHHVGAVGWAERGSSVPVGWTWLCDGAVLSPVVRGPAVEPAVVRAWCPCPGPARGRCVRRCRDRHPNRPPREPCNPAQGRSGDGTVLLRKTLRGLSCGGGIHA